MTEHSKTITDHAYDPRPGDTWCRWCNGDENDACHTEAKIIIDRLTTGELGLPFTVVGGVVQSLGVTAIERERVTREQVIAYLTSPAFDEDAVWARLGKEVDLIEDGINTATHLAVVLTGGHVPAHVPGAYPSLSCCGGSIQIAAGR